MKKKSVGTLFILVSLCFLLACSTKGEQEGAAQEASLLHQGLGLEECPVRKHSGTSQNQPSEDEKSSSLPEESSLKIQSTQVPRILLTKKEFNSTAYPALESAADSALQIASVLLNSQEFRDSIHTLALTCRAKVNCRRHCSDCDARLEAREVLDSIYREKTVALTLSLDNENAGSFGSAAMNVYAITSHYPVIRSDDRSLPFSYSYAYHIAHEYMHIVGFTHKGVTNSKDVAYRVGVMGYRIIKRWHQANINPMGIQP